MFCWEQKCISAAHSTALDELPPLRLKVHIRTKHGTERRAAFPGPPPPLPQNATPVGVSWSRSLVHRQGWQTMLSSSPHLSVTTITSVTARGRSHMTKTRRACSEGTWGLQPGSSLRRRVTGENGCRMTVGLMSPMGSQGPAKSPFRAVGTNQALSSL